MGLPCPHPSDSTPTSASSFSVYPNSRGGAAVMLKTRFRAFHWHKPCPEMSPIMCCGLNCAPLKAMFKAPVPQDGSLWDVGSLWM